ncbi:MAG: hypothetical protein WAM07_10490 [Halobacillus sp.]|uniref:hypothetical protein n=1 Tax=Halobacillus sp. TaxID=56800 RepID=UPI003BB0FC85
MDENLKKKIEKEESIVGFSALFIVLIMSFGGVPSIYIGISLITIVFLQFMWDFYEVNRRNHSVYKRTLKRLIYVSLLVVVVSVVFSQFR